MSIPSNNKDEVDSGGFKKSIDERVFSDFDIDGSAKDWRQEAMSRTSGSSLAYNTKADSKDAIEDFLDGMEVLAELNEAQQKSMEKMRFSNGFEFTREEFEDAIDKVIEEIEADPAKFAEENDMSLAQVAMMIEMGNYAKENNSTPNELEQKFGKENYDAFQGLTQKNMEASRDHDLDKGAIASKENTDIDKSADLTAKEQTAKVEIESDGLGELDFLETSNSSTSMAKTLSPDETATASIKNDFGKAVNITIADTNIPAQEIIIERQNILTA